jgi:nucleotide-binding universal stress UspA family protein
MSNGRGVVPKGAKEGSPEVPFRVVAGVDGSEPSLRALRWAGHQAALVGVPLVVVTAWTFPEHPAPLGIVAQVPWQDELMVEARAKLDDIVAATLGDGRPEHVEAKVMRGPAAAVLLDEVQATDLLVVGSSGRGAFSELLGSVSERCVRHAPCPVVVVR